jgi:tRNA pseudouridine55 synthase
VVIHAIEVHAVQSGEDTAGPLLDVAVTVRASSGTYVRAIARDVGAALAVGGHLTALRRTAIGAGERAVTLADARTLEDLQGTDPLPVMGMGEAGRRFFDWVQVGSDEAVRVGHGKRLTLGLPSGRSAPTAVIGPEGSLLGLYAATEPRDDGDAKPVAVFC